MCVCVQVEAALVDVDRIEQACPHYHSSDGA